MRHCFFGFNSVPCNTPRGFTTPNSVLKLLEIDVSYAHPFQCQAWYKVPEASRRKLDPKYHISILLSSLLDKKGYRLWDVQKKMVVKSQDVIFDTPLFLTVHHSRIHLHLFSVNCCGLPCLHPHLLLSEHQLPTCLCLVFNCNHGLIAVLRHPSVIRKQYLDICLPFLSLWSFRLQIFLPSPLPHLVLSHHPLSFPAAHPDKRDNLTGWETSQRLLRCLNTRWMMLINQRPGKKC